LGAPGNALLSLLLARESKVIKKQETPAKLRASPGLTAG
jgi:hypothetical protein